MLGGFIIRYYSDCLRRVGSGGSLGVSITAGRLSGIVLSPRPSPAPSRHSGARHRDCFGAIHGQLADSELPYPEFTLPGGEKVRLDEPAYARFFAWLFGALHGDFGRALTNQRDIMEELWPRFMNTLFLAGYSAIILWRQNPSLGIVILANSGKCKQINRLAVRLMEVAVGGSPASPIGDGEL